MMERMVNDYKKAQYMEKRVGQVFEGTIVGVMSFGFFVEMDNTVEGLFLFILYQMTSTIMMKIQ